ncbi:MAG TPA: PfaB family protein [Nostoc sp.]|uniref:PfaB family protein n=1 Tax=Nostoc sp. TaxID=1180 RepID=UPI002D3C0597|nr:PfaB family protein [Nostoc sp.]HYX17849.1 PfaB family protein [Nostoc sp.]
MTIKLAIVGIEAFFGTCHGLDKFERSIYDATQYFIPIPPIRCQGIQPKLPTVEEEDSYNNQALLGAYIQDFEIDAFHFKIPPNDIDKHDPKQLLMLKVIDQALKDAKLDQKQKKLQNVAIVAVINENQVNKLDRKLVETGDNDNISSEKINTVFQKISTLWNTSGPNFVVNAKENSVFEALETAKTLLTVGPVDCVVVSAVNFAGVDCVMSGKPTLSYDCNASGSIVGEGAGAIVLKRYEKAKHDRDRIYAVIDTVSHLYESSTNAAESVKQSCHKAFAKARVSPADIGYLEVFASGNEQQDRAEIQGLIQAYQVPNSELSCAIGSVKANIGHTYIASGIASLIKTALCLHNRYIPATPQWTSPKNPEILQDSPFYVPTESRPWFLNSAQTTRVAAINSLASDGTYVHIILSEDSSSQDRNHRCLEQTPFYLFPIAANNQSGLLEQLETLEQIIKNSSSLSTVANQTFATFQNNPQAIYALAIVGQNQDELLREIQRGRKGIPSAFAGGKDWKSPSGSYFTAKPQGKQGHIAFIYPGAFNSYIGMGRKLFYLFPKTFERATSFVSQPNLFFREKLLYPRSLNQISKRQLEDLDAKLLNDPLSMQVSGTGFSVLLTHILRDYFQIQPQAAFGYSMGESTMLYSLNVWTNGDNVHKFVHSSELFQTRLVGAKKTVRDYWDLPENAHEEEAVWHSYVLMAPLSSVVSRLKQETQVYLTNINTPTEVVIAGEPQACQRAIADLNCDAFRAPADLVLHCEPMAGEYDELIKLNSSPTQNVSGINFYSSANYDLMPLDRESLAHRVSQGFCQRVDFPRLVNQVYEDGARIFIEVGPGNTCSRWIADNLQQKEHVTISINRRGADDYTAIVKALAQLLSHRAPVDLSPLYSTTAESSNQKKSFLKKISLEKYPLMAPSLSDSNNENGENLDSISLSKSTASISKKSADVIFDEADVLEFAQGQVSKVLGKDYEIIDPYPRRVRLPNPPYLFINRVNKIEGIRGEYGSGFIQTEYDLPADAWFAVDGQIPIGIYEEAGQGFLLLLGYLGTDFDNQGQRSFRLLDLTATFLSYQPENIKTMRYDVKINSAVKTASNLVVFFSGECFLNDKLFLKISGGCAGLFSDEELDQGQGIIFTERDEKERSQIQKQHFQPLLSCQKSTFHRQDLVHLTQGNIAACFGSNYQQNGLNPSLRLPSEKLLMFDQVLSVDPQGGAAGLGLVTATKTVEPSDWYFLCHFKNDPTMPGSLMVEGSSQLLQFYMLFLGLQSCTKNARFQAITQRPQIVRFRGQVTPAFGTLTYRIEVIEMGRSPQPFAIANVEIIYGNKIIAYIKNLGLQLSEKPKNT